MNKPNNNSAYDEHEDVTQYTSNHSLTEDKKISKNGKKIGCIKESKAVHDKMNEHALEEVLQHEKGYKYTLNTGLPESCERLHSKNTDTESIRLLKSTVHHTSKDTDMKNILKPQTQRISSIANNIRHEQECLSQSPNIGNRSTLKAKKDLSRSISTGGRFKHNTSHTSSNKTDVNKTTNSDGSKDADSIESNLMQFATVKDGKDKIEAKITESSLNIQEDKPGIRIQRSLTATDRNKKSESRKDKLTFKSIETEFLQDNNSNANWTEDILTPRIKQQVIKKLIAETTSVRLTSASVKNDISQTKTQTKLKGSGSKCISQQHPTHSLKTNLKLDDFKITALGTKKSSDREGILKTRNYYSKSTTNADKSKANVLKSSTAIEDKEKSKITYCSSKSISKENKCMPSNPKKETEDQRSKAKSDTPAKAEMTFVEDDFTSSQQKKSAIKNKIAISSSEKLESVTIQENEGICIIDKSTLTNENNKQNGSDCNQSWFSSLTQNQINSKHFKDVKQPHKKVTIKSLNKELGLDKDKSMEKIEKNQEQTQKSQISNDFNKLLESFENEKGRFTKSKDKSNESFRKWLSDEMKSRCIGIIQDKTRGKETVAKFVPGSHDVSKTKPQCVKRLETHDKVSTSDRKKEKVRKISESKKIPTENLIIRTTDTYLSLQDIDSENTSCSEEYTSKSISQKKDICDMNNPTCNLRSSEKSTENITIPTSDTFFDRSLGDQDPTIENIQRSAINIQKRDKEKKLSKHVNDVMSLNDDNLLPNTKSDEEDSMKKEKIIKNLFEEKPKEVDQLKKMSCFDEKANSGMLYKKALFQRQKETKVEKDEHALLKSPIQSSEVVNVASQTNVQLENHTLDNSFLEKSLENEPVKPKGTEQAFLNDLFKKDDSSVIVHELLNNRPVLNHYMATKDENDIHLFTQVLLKAFETKNLEMILQLFEYLKSGGFFNKLVDYLLHVFIQIKTRGISGKYIQNILESIFGIQMAHLSRNPSSFRTFRKLNVIIGQVIEELDKAGSSYDKVSVKYRHLSELLRDIEKDRKKESVQEKQNEPPDDFRQYPTAPSIDEITGIMKPFLRPIKKTGRYDDLHDYLDVHFRLFREDFVRPLREGISGLINIMSAYKGKSSTSERIKDLDIKIYENVRVVLPIVSQQGLCYKMKLQMTPDLKRIKWKFSKRLIYGSMVCLTDKDFKEFLLATVVEREEKDIVRGYFVLHFEKQDVCTESLQNRMFIMAETSGYFEAYRHVLCSLKTCRNGDLPFEKYIIRCERSVGYPAYLSPDLRYDLRPLVETNVQLKALRNLTENKVPYSSTDVVFSHFSTQAKNVHLTNLKDWPSKEVLRMDESQYRAVQSALTREFAIIQGPPGTGKTYIGLQIVKTLLHNKSIWNKPLQKCKPILVVCYTNHALDQFLEGIVKFYKGDIVRVGGRSNSEDLEEFNLKRYRKIKFRKKSNLSNLQFQKREARRRMEVQSECVQRLAKMIQVYQSDIVNENSISEEIGDRLFESLINDYKGKVKQGDFSYIVKWLGIEFMKVQCLKEIRKAQKLKKVKHIKVEDEIARTLKDRMIDIEANVYILKNERSIVRRIRNENVAFYVEDVRSPSSRKGMDSFKETELDQKFKRIFKAKLMSKITDNDVMSNEEADSVQNVWRLDHKAKWRLYRLWIRKSCSALYEKIEEEKANFEAASKRYRDALLSVDKAIMQKAVAIGMTTSGAARYQSVLRDIGPKIIVVEEAAEVLEAHIITTLSNKCEHLILIGDHKQLRPNPSVYELEVKYNLDISLFERMVTNGIEYNCLELQHRMRPEISSIMRQIYPDLKDHEHVRSYPNVKGVSTNLFLISHSHLETCSDEIKSYSNTKEAEYAVALCRYLLLQGYKKEEITILTTYTGQLMCIRNLMPEDEFDGVHVTVVDNYQGEENQIVILSLVRSNTNGKIGFLKTENRICVALSRAKIGLYIIANFSHLASHGSLWARITADMTDKNLIGDGLVLCCQNHPNDNAIEARKAEDFQKAPEGGCLKMCDARLECGHKCVRYCHVVDKDHKETKCMKSCTKTLCDLGHKCPDKCFMECPPCSVLVTKIIPDCGHSQNVPCAKNPEEYCCQELCKTLLQCGHPCKERCGEAHTTKCNEKVLFTWSCGHSSKIMCWETETKLCPQPCGSQLMCKHKCSGTCGSCFMGRVHKQCRHEFSTTHPCGHKSLTFCQNNQICTKPCANRCSHTKCTKRCGEICTPCNLPCTWKCSHKHCKKRCGEQCDRTACSFPCKKILKCNHNCIGLCGEPCPSICRLCNKTKFKSLTYGKKQNQNALYVLLEQCGHLVEYQTMDEIVKREKAVCCPKCRATVTHCLRYGNIIKAFLNNIEQSKKKVIGNLSLHYKLSSKISDITIESASGSLVYAEIELGNIKEDVAKTKYPYQFYKVLCTKELRQRLNSLEKPQMTEKQLLTIEKQLQISMEIAELIQRFKEMEHEMCNTEKVNSFVSFLHKLVMIVIEPKEVLTDQENEDLKREIQRGKTYLKLLKLNMLAIPLSVAAKIRDDFKKIETILLGQTRIPVDMDIEIDKSIGCLGSEIEMYKKKMFET